MDSVNKNPYLGLQVKGWYVGEEAYVQTHYSRQLTIRQRRFL
jgi:hypothetical protein